MGQFQSTAIKLGADLNFLDLNKFDVKSKQPKTDYKKPLHGGQ